MVDLGGFAPPSRTLFSLLHTAITYIILPVNYYVNRGIANQPMSLTFRRALHPPKPLCDFTISDTVIYGIGTTGVVVVPVVSFTTAHSVMGISKVSASSIVTPKKDSMSATALTKFVIILNRKFFRYNCI